MFVTVDDVEVNVFQNIEIPQEST